MDKGTECLKAIEGNIDMALERLEQLRRAHPEIYENAAFHDAEALIGGIRMMVWELEPDKLDIMPYAGYKNDEFYATITYQQGGKDDGKWGV